MAKQMHLVRGSVDVVVVLRAGTVRTPLPRKQVLSFLGSKRGVLLHFGGWVVVVVGGINCSRGTATHLIWRYVCVLQLPNHQWWHAKWKLSQEHVTHCMHVFFFLARIRC